MLALTRGILGAYGLAVDALRGETLDGWKRVLVFWQYSTVCVYAGTILVLCVTGRNENGGMSVAGKGGRDV